MGGAHSVAGASVQLVSSGEASYRVAGPVLSSAITDSTGKWTLEVPLCDSDAPVYVVASGGDAGGGPNSAIKMISVLGSCDSLPPVVSVAIVNEMTTIAATSAMRQFMSNAGDIGAPTRNLRGSTNAASTITTNLVDPDTGLARGPLIAATGVTVPTRVLNTLADILAECVQSAGPTSIACQHLFCSATTGASWNTNTGNNTCTLGQGSPPEPTDTTGAALGLGLQPGAALADLEAIIPANPPFQPTLGSPPTDWSIVLGFSGAGLSSSTAVAIDSIGNAWIANQFPDSLSEFSPTGSVLSPTLGFTTGLDAPFSMAMDSSNNIWIVNCGAACGGGMLNGAVVELSNTDTVLRAGGSNVVPNTSPNKPGGIAIDGSSNVWVASPSTTAAVNSGNGAIIELSSAANLVSPQGGYFGGGVMFPKRIAIDPFGDAWITNSCTPGDNLAVDGDVAELGVTGSPLSPGPTVPPDFTNPCGGYIGGGVSDPTPIAFDSSGNVWVGNNGSLTELNPLDNGMPLSPGTGFLGLETSTLDLAGDGAGNIWTANLIGGISEFSPSGAVLSPGPYGFEGGVTDSDPSVLIANPFRIAIDGSGNVWAAEGNLPAGNGQVAQFLGLAAPIVTPLIGPPKLP